MSAHTHGPWINHGNGDIVAQADTADGLTDICTIFPRLDDSDEANANLVAAAPDLLAIVQKLVELSPFSVGYSLDFGLAALDDLQKEAALIIAKAEGRS